MLEEAIKQQLKVYLDMLEQPILIQKSIGQDTASKEVDDLIESIASMSDKVHVEAVARDRTPSFTVSQLNQESRVAFAGIPLGHEFESLILALLQVSGRPPKISEQLKTSIQKIDQKLHFETYISMSCHNCPDVVQALNVMSILNPQISHTMIEGGSFKEEVATRSIMAVPTVYLNGEPFESGRMALEDILKKLGQKQDYTHLSQKEIFDVLVVGAGPAGASAAIYAARKGLKTGVVGGRVGGQIMDTLAIENFISVPYTEGPKLAHNLEAHMHEYGIDVMQPIQITDVYKEENLIKATVDENATLVAKTVIIATGAKWRQLGVPGEDAYRNKGVAYCPHCDGPLYKGKKIAVVGGGNSGVEAAIDLANIAEHITLLEFLPTLKADEVLQDKLKSLSNVTILTGVQVKAITGDQSVNGITYQDLNTKEEIHLPLAGIFVQIGLSPNTECLGEGIQKNRIGEIITDKKGATSLEGVFAAGDCTDTPYKQIIIAMGSGATASLSAFDYLIRTK